MLPGTLWAWLPRVRAETARSGALWSVRAARGTVPDLLVRPHERELDDAFARSIGPRAVRWHVANAGHTRGLDEHPQEYARRVRAFLDDALR